MENARMHALNMCNTLLPHRETLGTLGKNANTWPSFNDPLAVRPPQDQKLAQTKLTLARSSKTRSGKHPGSYSYNSPCSRCAPGAGWYHKPVCHTRHLHRARCCSSSHTAARTLWCHCTLHNNNSHPRHEGNSRPHHEGNSRPHHEARSTRDYSRSSSSSCRRPTSWR